MKNILLDDIYLQSSSRRSSDKITSFSLPASCMYFPASILRADGITSSHFPISFSVVNFKFPIYDFSLCIYLFRFNLTFLQLHQIQCMFFFLFHFNVVFQFLVFTVDIPYDFQIVSMDIFIILVCGVSFTVGFNDTYIQ